MKELMLHLLNGPIANHHNGYSVALSSFSVRREREEQERTEIKQKREREIIQLEYEVHENPEQKFN